MSQSPPKRLNTKVAAFGCGLHASCAIIGCVQYPCDLRHEVVYCRYISLSPTSDNEPLWRSASQHELLSGRHKWYCCLRLKFGYEIVITAYFVLSSAETMVSTQSTQNLGVTRLVQESLPPRVALLPFACTSTAFPSTAFHGWVSVIRRSRTSRSLAEFCLWSQHYDTPFPPKNNTALMVFCCHELAIVKAYWIAMLSLVESTIAMAKVMIQSQ